MHHVQSTPEHYWNSGNLEKCFVDTLRLLLHGLQEKMICDIFFPEVISDSILSFGMESDRTSLLLECNLEASGESLGSDQVEPGEKGDRRLVGPSPQKIRQNWQSHADFLLKMLFLFSEPLVLNKMAIYCPQGSGTLRQQYTLIYSVILCFTLLYSALHCSTLLYSALHCSTLL